MYWLSLKIATDANNQHIKKFIDLQIIIKFYIITIYIFTNNNYCSIISTTNSDKI